ncbi:hypothetical protein WA1_01725 [Scytonema hofmannii PCC 7110]|uniref:SPOR domain-containing protein n=1 Tax=Scytonema hofmannii PCC 7110 TaxID=128403 RepID=A0A139XGS1_9CYAN|nr:SPOR domain-containing protein [Scytonema hofmannii]KYC43896.1 hypothetical protein WA1_01725 [Scytonema hofmannii PCC 7110]
MSQNSLVDTSSAQSSKPYRLRPALAAALASLEVQLDQELTRYRRTKTGYRTLSQIHVGKVMANQPQSLSAIATTGGKSQLLAEDSLGDELEKFGFVATPSAPVGMEKEDIAVPATTINTPLTSTEEPLQKASSPAKAEDILQRETLQSLAASVSSTIKELESSLSSDHAKTKTTTGSSSVSIVPTSVKEHVSQKNLAEVDNHDSRTQPNDYLESSEALLRSLTEEQSKEKKQPSSSNDSLLSPLGIGSMLLLLVASMTLGYVVFNPKSLPQISLDGLFKKNPQLATETLERSAKSATNIPEPTLTPLRKYPNLANQEFPELRDPNDVVGLKPKSKPAPPAIAPNPVPPPFPINPPTQRVQPLPPPTATLPSPIVTASPKPKPPSVKPTPNAEIKPSADGLYHIITDNKDSNALASARKIIPDAYLSENGAFIYLGALKSKEKAQTLLQQLQNKGIKARISDQ